MPRTSRVSGSRFVARRPDTRVLAAFASVALTALIACMSASAAVTAGVAALGPAPAGQTLELVFPLVADDAGLRRLAFALSTPGSPSYGRFEPLSELAQRFGASPSRAAAVVRYLRAHGADAVRLSATRMYVSATFTAGRAERMFDTPLDRLRSADGEEFLAPAARASAASATAAVPSGLRGLVAGVVGLDTESLTPADELRTLVPRRPARAADVSQPSSAYLPRTGTASGCAGARGSAGFTPNQYLTAYGIADLHRAGLTGHGERVAVIEIDGFKQSDITTFGRCFGINVPRLATHTVGFSRPLAPGGEATLDLEVLSASVPGARAIDVYEIQDDAARFVQGLEAPLIAPGAKPQVISASLGTCEPFLGGSLGAAGVSAIERTLELAAATGTTVLSSAGDDGSSACQFNNGDIEDQLAVSYPASSAFVTAVGGTNVVLDAANHITDETVWNDTDVSTSAGGGGLSGLFSRPAYQQGVVSADARELPDVALLADLAPGYAIYCSAKNASVCRGWISVGGTSAAAPLLAGGLALVDQDLARHHKQLLGMVNPLLYHFGTSSAGASIFRDVTAIGNDIGPWIPGSEGQPVGCCTAGPGFDAASGWGSVNLAAFDAAALRSAHSAPDISLTLPAHQHPVAVHAIFARVRCSAPCRAYVSGNVVLSRTAGVGVRSAPRRFRVAGSQLLRIPLSASLVGRLRAAERAHHDTYTELFAIALDAQGKPLSVTAGSVIHFSG